MECKENGIYKCAEIIGMDRKLIARRKTANEATSLAASPGNLQPLVQTIPAPPSKKTARINPIKSHRQLLHAFIPIHWLVTTQFRTN